MFSFAVNHLAYYLLTVLLLPRLKASAPSIILNTGSDGYKLALPRGGMRLDDLQFERPGDYWAFGAYAHSKLLNLAFTRELARRLADPANGAAGVTTVCVHPGPVFTRIANNNGWWVPALKTALALLFRSPREGARGLLWAATVAPPPANGAYVVHWSGCSPYVESVSLPSEFESAERTLWEKSAALCGGASWPINPGPH